MRIDPAKQDWMCAPETAGILTALGEARFVGGAVRNALLGLAVNDIDIAVPLPPEDAQARLEQAGIKVVPTGIDHGTITAIKNGKVFEITSLRRDVETDGRHALVAYTADWAQDAARRDFTINALYATSDGEIFDYHGGVQDLAAGRVRFVGDARARIAEDYLRILRLFRFHAWYGKGEVDGEALRAAADARGRIAKLSGERIAKELLKLLEAPNPTAVLRVMAASAILPQLLPGELNLARLEHMILADAENHFAADAVLRLGALLPDAQTARRVGERLKLSNANAARLEDLAGAADMAPAPAPEIHRALYKLGAARFEDRVRLSWAAAPPQVSALAWRMLLAMAKNWERPKFPLSGRDVMAAGVPEGPAVGQVLEAVEAWWMEQDFPGDQAVTEKLNALVVAGL